MPRVYDYQPHKPASIVHFDWLTAVVTTDNLDQYAGSFDFACDVLLQLGLGSFHWEHMKHGIYTYNKGLVTGDNSIIVGYDDDVNNLMIQASGSGVSAIEEAIKTEKGWTIADYIKAVIKDFNGSFSRVDACNNFINYPLEFSPSYLNQEASNGNLITTSRRVRYVHEYASKGAVTDKERAWTGADEGSTLYIGRSPKQMRIYNKLAERSEKINVRYDMDSWFRWEFELNGVQAQGFIDAYLDRNCDLVQTWIDWLSSNYRWIERVGEHQEKRSRYPNATWYDQLIKTAHDKIKVRRDSPVQTFARTTKWLDNQVMTSVANMYFARYKKYIANGVSDEDAQMLAFQKIKNDIDDKVVNDEVNLKLVDSWLLEQGLQPSQVFVDAKGEREKRNMLRR